MIKNLNNPALKMSRLINHGKSKQILHNFHSSSYSGQSDLPATLCFSFTRKLLEICLNVYDGVQTIEK
ncbi:MAG: hypothetical protein ACJAW2_000454 [Shewanella sp.]|jgi:hypothetical protein